MDRKSEGPAVKRHLIAMGFNKNNVRVTHGTGTAWGWLKVYVEIHHKPGCTCYYDGINPQKLCEECNNLWRDCYKRILELVIDGSMRNDCEAERIGIYLNFFDK